ncbi:glycoside hydrolase family 16 protein [Cylindrobasidium torrendii FP15055 ss-10]|uniref:Glycoside hydrolase family 16 protein n=1 Tax=Cylindrobasidium torrendii FP15055 ss-10 TaxID=1314674 RepID=A0A0D7BQL3_9AGAR|nr:glycoside hydrolase family 16 protein [Cylindrobasidium torrendii FP15055 ss-10]
MPTPYQNFPSSPSSSRLLPSGQRESSMAPSISEKFSLSPDPQSWGASLLAHEKEPDDWLHNPDPRRDQDQDAGGSIFTARGAANLGCMFVLGTGLVALFAGYPIANHFVAQVKSNNGGFNLGGINATGQIPDIGNFGLIDQDTPKDVYTKVSYDTGEEMQLVFSDEFNIDGRTFYPGEDPYWEAVDMHYWGTNNLEWYDPGQLKTANGALEVTLEDTPHRGLDYKGGMMSTWNKFCFTGGLIETAVILPGANNVQGLWPAIWSMGNLGRAGYGATLDGMWPYSYDACDVGTAPNQTINGRPYEATVDGDAAYNGALSFLPGQKLSRCTCPGSSHPGPMHSDGTYVGRAAPEIDMFEAQVGTTGGHVSQSCQWAPFNYAYEWHNVSNVIIYDEDHTELNSYKGGVYQQATSGVSLTNQECYQEESRCFAIYGFEYRPGYDEGYILWLNDGRPAWKQFGAGTAADPRVEISARPIPVEPMYIIVNLGISENFGFVDYENLIFPAIMYVDWIRVYQPKGSINVGCDPKEYPTKAYIEEYIEAYTNPNLTTWVDDYKQPFPKNSLVDGC